jgi:DUSAM domain-containing protein
MDAMDAALDEDWNRIWGLHNQVEQGRALELTGEVRELLLRGAHQVAIPDTEAEQALQSISGATELLRLIAQRIREGSNRIMDALHRMYRLREKGDLEGARQQMRDVLAVEVVPHYRETAEGQLDELGERP